MVMLKDTTPRRSASQPIWEALYVYGMLGWELAAEG